MAMNDPLGDMLTRIRNAQMRRKAQGVDAGLEAARARARRAARTKAISAAIRRRDFGNGRTEFEIELKYFDGEPVIQQIERVRSRAGASMRRSTRMPRVANGLGITIVSTPKGVMADHAAREHNVGGEVLCKVF